MFEGTRETHAVKLPLTFTFTFSPSSSPPQVELLRHEKHDLEHRFRDSERNRIRLERQVTRLKAAGTSESHEEGGDTPSELQTPPPELQKPLELLPLDLQAALDLEALDLEALGLDLALGDSAALPAADARGEPVALLRSAGLEGRLPGAVGAAGMVGSSTATAECQGEGQQKKMDEGKKEGEDAAAVRSECRDILADILSGE